MKTIFLKKVFPFAVVLVTGVSGAFLTTSMQSSKHSLKPPVIGYADGPSGPCTIPVQCQDVKTSEFCRVNYPNGAQAKNPEDCAEVLWRPEN